MRLTASSIVSAAAVLLAGLAGFAGREAWAQAAPSAGSPRARARYDNSPLPQAS